MVLTLILATKGNSYVALWSLQWTITIARYVLVHLLHLMIWTGIGRPHIWTYFGYFFCLKLPNKRKKVPNKYGMSIHPIVPHTQHRYCRALGQG